ncbi:MULTISPECIES: GreA/GreB family elongation factor [Streptomyces]|jgi:transcription elongation factor GreA|uniref:GreA/GreB family elongation factor n=1 Tax=unclassified Streptomyces TaxID=2593676 RepID=UPI00088537A4|nr:MULTISPECIES: GreA/GreB family elongation factor [unclassified Streptomyces]MDX2733231.1 GreA/GreB family elongation factor [Streptomyces sp. PA03-2a]SCX95155.1 Transcription elongation factor, GreA/GreB family [Streptomyces sp. 136MFCol5.1]SFS41722.1 Transcription elongation factor, GreA/GreB family [Streptomyces sp. ok210]
MTGGPEPISDVAREALERELADLRAERETVAATLRGGERVGDMADEADELQRGTELDRLDTRIAEVDGRLREAAVAGPPRTDRVGVGSTVTVRFADSTEATVQIGEVAEVLDRTLVTADSPLGRALLGCRAGDTINYETPEGRSTAVVLSLGDAGDRS